LFCSVFYVLTQKTKTKTPLPILSKLRCWGEAPSHGRRKRQENGEKPPGTKSLLRQNYSLYSRYRRDMVVFCAGLGLVEAARLAEDPLRVRWLSESARLGLTGSDGRHNYNNKIFI